MRNPCLFVCARDTSVCCVQGSELLACSFQVDPIVEPDVLNTSESHGTDCVGVQRSVIRIVNR